MKWHVLTTLWCVSMTPRGLSGAPRRVLEEGEIVLRRLRLGEHRLDVEIGRLQDGAHVGARAALSSTPLRNQPMVATATASASAKMAPVASTPSVG